MADVNPVRVPEALVRIAKVIGENDDGLTLFVPKDMTGRFKIAEGDAFLTVVFVRPRGRDVTGARVTPWLPWDDEEDDRG